MHDMSAGEGRILIAIWVIEIIGCQGVCILCECLLLKLRIVSGLCIAKEIVEQIDIVAYLRDGLRFDVAEVSIEFVVDLSVDESVYG
ncbi:hypothetical protein V6N11_051658 [Hibiscus sabdariffa]|uniref:Uncharacterized protein n=1 Tax=Hibiscus sabdariffa TaxID=183260 RepID=A0ABR2U7R6_9ROSI